MPATQDNRKAPERGAAFEPGWPLLWDLQWITQFIRWAAAGNSGSIRNGSLPFLLPPHLLSVTPVWHVISWNLTQALKSQTHLSSHRTDRDKETGGEQKSESKTGRTGVTALHAHTRTAAFFCLFVFVCFCFSLPIVQDRRSCYGKATI